MTIEDCLAQMNAMHQKTQWTETELREYRVLAWLVKLECIHEELGALPPKNWKK